MALHSAAAVRSWDSVRDVLTALRIDPALWSALTNVMGDPGDEIRHIAALNQWAIVQAIGAAQVSPGQGVTVIQAAQLGLMWRSCRKNVFLKDGGAEGDFVDIDPWEQKPAATPKASPPVQSVKESVLKMSSLLDQTDDSELLPPKPEMVQLWMQKYVLTMGAPPEEEEPTESQLAALHKRVGVLGQAPYVDFGVWLPFGRRALKAQKFRVYHPVGDGSYMLKEMPGPQNYQQWLASWRVFKVAALMLGIVSLANLSSYEKLIERLVVQWPSSWGLICQAEDKARAERLEKIRRRLLSDDLTGKTLPSDWDRSSPWSCCFRELISDEKFWSEQVRHPAVAWTAAGGRGAPMATAEMIAGTHIPGIVDAADQGRPPEAIERRKQANKDKRLARKRRVQEDRDELARLRANAPRKTGNDAKGDSKGAGKGKSKDQAGSSLCYSWGSGKGPCADVPVGGECKCPVKRVHKCQFCLSPAHRNADCPNR